jgi:heptosyltransferase-1
MIAYLYLCCLDKFFHLCVGNPKPSKVHPPKKILLTNLAHIGDVINATSVLPILKKAFPNVKIGFVVGSHSIELIENHPLIDNIYLVDHWILNRSKTNVLKKIIRYLKTYRQAIKSIKEDNYDIALDLYLYIGKASTISYRCHIPIRIGYNMRVGRNKSCGGNLLTHRLIFKDKGVHITEYYKAILRFLPIDERFLTSLKPTLVKVNDDNFSNLSSYYPSLKKKYIVLHPGAGVECRKWPDLYWLELLGLLINQDIIVVITGKGKQEKMLSTILTSSYPQTIDLVDRLSLSELRAIYKNSSLLVGVESQAGHLAAELNIETILIYTGIAKLGEWTPKSDKACIVQSKVSCSPCYRGSGCKTMDCIKGVKPLTVFSSILDKLNFSQSKISS